MAEIKWIKLSTNMFDDEKIKLIRTMPEGDSIALIWVQILCLAGKINDGGWVYMGQNLAYSDEMLATILDHPLNTMRIALQTLEQFNMIDVTSDGKIDVLNWEKHQSTDKMARIAQQNRERQQRYYYRNKLRELGLDVDSKDFTDDLEELKKMTEEPEKPNVSHTLPNDTEVRSKKLEVRSKKLEVNNIEQEKPSNKLHEKDLKEDFENLWKKHPNKKGNKKSSFKKYVKAIEGGAKHEEISKGLDKFIAYCQQNKWYTPAYASTWFSQKRWEDDYEVNTQEELGHTADAPTESSEVKYDDDELEYANNLIEKGVKQFNSLNAEEQKQLNAWRQRNAMPLLEMG